MSDSSVEFQRRFDRVPVMRAGELRIRAPRPRSWLGVSIRTVTCEGAGVVVSHHRREFHRGAAVELRFQIAGRPLCVPGTIAWHRPTDGAAGPVNAGIRFFIEAAARDTSRIYADWIVSLLIGPAPTELPTDLFAWRDRILHARPPM